MNTADLKFVEMLLDMQRKLIVQEMKDKNENDGENVSQMGQSD